MVSTVVALVLAGSAWGLRRHFTSPPALGPVRSLAVLPFANHTGDPHNDYFVDGLTDELGSALARIKGLRVVSSTTAAQFKATRMPAAEIARQLSGVEGLVEGAVTRSGQRIRVTVDLVDARRDQRIWTDSYESELGDILKLYHDVAQAVAHEIQRAGSNVNSVNATRRVDPIAYDKFLQAIVNSRDWQVGGCERAEPLLKQAIDRDPTFAEAYTELGHCYVFPDRLERPGAEVAPLAHKVVARALELDPSLPSAYVTLGSVRHHLDFDWPGAQMALERALELNPNDPEAHVLYGELLCASGRGDEGLPHIQESLRLDPLSRDRQVAFGFALRNTGHFDAAIEQFTRVLTYDPSLVTAMFWLAESYGDSGRRDQAVSAYLRFLENALAPDRAASASSSLRSIYTRRGWSAFWEAELALTIEPAQTGRPLWKRPYRRFSGLYLMARRYARLGYGDRALDALGKAYADRSHLIVLLDREPLFDALKNDARFHDLRRRVGLVR